MGNSLAIADVTGVVSGQQAALAIARRIQYATETYRIALQTAIASAHALGNQAMSAQVGFAANSTVIARLVEAAEILAVEIARANQAAATVGPMFVGVASEFARRNS